MNSQLCLPFHLRFRSRKIERVDPRVRSKVKSKAFGLLAAWFNLPEKLVNLTREFRFVRIIIVIIIIIISA